MEDDLKTVFISYRRRVSSWFAHSVYRHLQAKGFDVFMDVESIDGGAFPPIILHQIEARAHFLLLLEEGAFAGVATEGDWLRRELEHALDTGRNIVPLLSRFTLESDEFRSTLRKLPAKFAALADMQAVPFPEEYVDAAFERLRTRALRIKPAGRVKPTPAAERPVVARMMEHAASATPDKGKGTWTLITGTPLTLRVKDGTLQWNRDATADAYTLERSKAGAFTGDVVYEGPATTWLIPIALRGAWFRVRTKGAPLGLSILEPAWSTPVYAPSIADLISSQDEAPKAPRLTGWDRSFPGLLEPAPKRSPFRDGDGYSLRWGSGSAGLLGNALDIRAATARTKSLLVGPESMALLERTEKPLSRGKIIYAGCGSSFVDTEPALLGCSYRVKLLSPSNKESPWSNVVEREGGIRQIR